jgi:hypothetical protein
MESWRKIWRVAQKMIGTRPLEALRLALLNDDPRLLQGATTSPPPLRCVASWPVEAACVFGYCGAVESGGFSPDGGAATVAQTEDYFANLCFNVDQEVKEPAACRWFLKFADETPRDEMRRLLLPEVQAELARRAEGERTAG